MKKIITAITLASTLGSSCASTHPGQMGTLVRGDVRLPLKISAKKESSFSDAHYAFITFTVENTADEIIRIKSTDLDFDDPVKSQVSVLVGKDLVAWADAHGEEEKANSHNNMLAQLGLILGGLALGITGQVLHSDAIKAVGAGTGLAGAGWTLSSYVSKSVQNSENPKQVPDEHIYSPFSIPAMKFVRKWAVIQHPKDLDLKKVYVDLTLEDGSEGTYAIAIN